jgi:tetratricopeptide (TPR) repeat protein
MNHPDVALCYNSLGEIYRNKKEYDTAIELHQRAIDIWKVVYNLDPNHPNFATSYHNLGLAYIDKGEYDNGIRFSQDAIDIWRVIYNANPYHISIAKSYNSLGRAYVGKETDYDKAISYYKQSLQIRLEVYKNSPNHPDIGTSYHNLGMAYFVIGDFLQQIYCADKAFKIFSLYTNQENIITSKKLYDSALVQLSNLSLLEENIEKAKKYYEHIDFSSVEFITLQLKQVDIAYEKSAVLAAINCQKVLIKVDPHLQYGNHYHNLACFYACSSNIKEANKAFINALTHPNAKISGVLHVEYAQFLI